MTVGASLVVEISVNVASPTFVGTCIMCKVDVPSDAVKLAVESDLRDVVLFFLVCTYPVA